MRFAIFFLAVLGIAFAPPSNRALAADISGRATLLNGRVIATGIPGAGAVSAVGVFHTGSPIHDLPAFAEYTTRGRVLDPQRVLVTSTSNFGSPGITGVAEGSVLSIDAQATGIRVPSAFAAAGGQASALDGRVQLFTAAGPAFINGLNTPGAVTAALPSVSRPLGISINNAFGRLWFPSVPRDGTAAGFESIVDPTGIPLANPPSKTAGGVFTGTITNRSQQIIPGALGSTAIGNALMGESPDGSKRAVFAILGADGSLIQIHTEFGLDGLAPPGTVTPQTQNVSRAGLIFNWVPNRILYATDAARNAIVVLPVGDDGHVFTTGTPHLIKSAALNGPIDLAPAVAETANGSFSSNTTLAGGSDFYVLNRDGSIVRMRQDGFVVAVRRVFIPGHGVVGAGQLAGIAISADASHLWVTFRGAIGQAPAGAVVEVPTFGAGVAVVRPQVALREGAAAFARTFSPATGLGPLFNERSCIACHQTPTMGGMGKAGLAVVVRVAHVGDRFDPLVDRGGPVSRAHSVRELGFACPLVAGIPATANVSSVRNAPALYNSSAIEAPDDATIAAGAVTYADGVHGRPNHVNDGDGIIRIGRFGWKADVARLETFVAVAFVNELGVTNQQFPRDLMRTRAPQRPCAGESRTPKDDGSLVRSVTAFVRSLSDPQASRAANAGGAALFASTGCMECHSTRLHAGNEPLYSDLLLHDMGPSLDDGIVQGEATGRDWRTTPLLGTATRARLLHDGRALTVAQAISAHAGEAAAAVAKYRTLDPAARTALVSFVSNL